MSAPFYYCLKSYKDVNVNKQKVLIEFINTEGTFLLYWCWEQHFAAILTRVGKKDVDLFFMKC